MQNKVIWALIVLAIGIIAFCMIFLMERYTEEEWLGPSKEARSNPFLAAEMYLESVGVRIEPSSQRLDFDAIPIDQVVVLSEVDKILVAPSEIDKAEDWVRRGGRLIVGVGTLPEATDSLLYRFEVDVYEDENTSQPYDFDDEFVSGQTTSERMREINKEIDSREDASDGQQSGEPDSGKPKKPASEKSLAELLNDILGTPFQREYVELELSNGESAYMALLDSLLLEHPSLYEQVEESNLEEQSIIIKGSHSTDYGVKILDLGIGAGSMTILSSTELWNNERIGLGDHALLLKHYVKSGATLQLFYNVKSPEFLSILYSSFKELVWAFALLLALWVWRKATRTRKTIELKPSGSRDFSEHLRASAKYILSSGNQSALLGEIQENIEHKLAFKYTNFGELEPQTQASIIADETELPINSILDWYELNKNSTNEDQFALAIRLGREIRKKL